MPAPVAATLFASKVITKAVALAGKAKFLQKAFSFGKKVVSFVKKIFKKDDEVVKERDHLSRWIVGRWHKLLNTIVDYSPSGKVNTVLVYPLYERLNIMKFKPMKVFGDYKAETERVISAYYSYVSIFEPFNLQKFEQNLNSGMSPSASLYALAGLTVNDVNRIPPLTDNDLIEINKNLEKLGIEIEGITDKPKPLLAGFAGGKIGTALFVLIVLSIGLSLGNK